MMIIMAVDNNRNNKQSNVTHDNDNNSEYDDSLNFNTVFPLARAGKTIIENRSGREPL